MNRPSASRTIAAALLAALALTGCQKSYFRVNVLHPAEVSLGRVRTIAVEEIVLAERPRSFSGTREKKPLTFGTVAMDLLLNVLGLNKADEDELSSQPILVTNRLVDLLRQNGHFTIVAPTSRGVEAVISGAGAYAVSEEGGFKDKTRKDKSGNDVAYKEYEISRKVRLDFTYRISDMSGNLLATRSLEGEASDNASAETEHDARDGLDRVEDMVDKALDNILGTLVVQIAPHYELEQIELEPGSSDRMATALEFARQLRWPQAVAIWQEVYDDRGSKDHAAASFDLGVASEVNGELDEAENYFREARSGSSDLAGAALDRIRGRREELRRLREQGR